MGGSSTWYIGTRLKDKLAALVPLSNAYQTGHSDLKEIKEFIANKNFDNPPVWGFIHKHDQVGGTPTSRELFNSLSENGYNPVYTHWFNTTHYNLTREEIFTKINQGQKYFYTEYDYPCPSNNCHYAMEKALKEDFLFEWLFRQQRE